MKVFNKIQELWDSIEKETLSTQRVMYQLMMNKSISSTPITKLEGVYLDRYKIKFKDVIAHERELDYCKIFLCEGV